MSLVLQDSQAEGRFGLMFKRLRGFVPSPDPVVQQQLIDALGQAMEELPKVVNPTNPEFDANDFPHDNPILPAGFTFLAQFIDHDFTFDQTDLALVEQDPNATANFRSPRFDLDSVYGGGPAKRPDLYDPADPDKFRIETYEDSFDTVVGNKKFTNTVRIDDVPRDPDTGAAIIADPRNDQTLILTQLHVAFMKFHNRLVDETRKQPVQPAWVFAIAQKQVRWHFQWMVIHEFLPRMVGPVTAGAVYKDVAGRAPVISLNYYKPANRANKAFIPVEVSVAAYRVGHSMARPRYTVRDVVDSNGQDVGDVSKINLLVSQLDAGNQANALNGGRRIPAKLKVQWKKFFEITVDRLVEPPAPNRIRQTIAEPKVTRRIDAKLSSPLAALPASAIADSNKAVINLAIRNLMRSQRFRLPSGQAVARAMNLKALTNLQLADKLQWYAATGSTSSEQEKLEPDTVIGPVIKDTRWQGEAPLWFYILREAELYGTAHYPLRQGDTGKSRHLGPVGGRIVAEFLVGILQRDDTSYLAVQPTWTPKLPSRQVGKFTIVDLLEYAYGKTALYNPLADPAGDVVSTTEVTLS